MPFTSCTVAINNITSLSDTPNTTDGLTSSALKAKFDKTGSDLKDYINTSLITVLNSTVAGSSGAENIGSALIGSLGTTVWNQINSLNTGVNTLGANKLNLSGGTLTGALALSAGTSSLPSLTTSGDTDTGIYFPAANTIGISTNGSEQARMDSTGRLSFGGSTFTTRLDTNSITPRLQVLGADRTYSSTLNAQFSADQNSSGLYFAKSRNATIGSHTIVQSGDDLGSISFGGSDGTNIVDAARILVEVDGTPGTNDMPGRIIFYTTADNASSPTERFRIANDGSISMTVGSTTSNAANLFIATTASGSVTGLIQRSTSSIKYKTNITDYNKGIEKLLQLRPVNYKGINDGDKQFAGFIAEEIHDLGLTEFVQYNENNEPESLAYPNMVALLTKAIQEQQSIIASLNERIVSLESKVN